MEITRDIEEAMQESRHIGGPSFRNNASNFWYQRGSGVVSQTETVKNSRSTQVSNGMESIARMRAPNNTQGSRIQESRMRRSNVIRVLETEEFKI